MLLVIGLISLTISLAIIIVVLIVRKITISLSKYYIVKAGL